MNSLMTLCVPITYRFLSTINEFKALSVMLLHYFCILQIHALITGPFDTPYEGGFFLFLFRCPPDYPIHPPRVKLITTGHNTVRFNPNFYRNGKVCLSILGLVFTLHHNIQMISAQVMLALFCLA